MSPSLTSSDALHIKLRGGFRLDQLERLIGAITPLSTLTEPARVVLDLSGLVFIGPAPLATLMAALAEATERDFVLPGSTYIPPANRLVARYLDRMDFNRQLTGTDFDDGFQRRAPKGFRPVQVFSEPEELGEVSDSLTLAATEALALAATDRASVLCAVREIAKNVLDHADSAIGGVAVAQRATSRREFEVAVADAGIGIAASLRRNPAYRELNGDAEAITTALAPGVTSNPGASNSGVGLTAIRSLLEANGGTMLIRSGRAAVEDGHRRDVREHLTELRGTVVAIRLQIGSPFEMEFYRLLDEAVTRLTAIVAE